MSTTTATTLSATLVDLRYRFDRAVFADDDNAAARLDALIRHDPQVAEVLPEVAAMDTGTSTRGVRHKDLADHVARVTVKVDSADRVGRLGAFFHDVGKPSTFQSVGGEATFDFHEAVGARITADVLGRLGYDVEFAARVVRLVEMSGRFKESDEWSDAAVRRYVADAGDVLESLLAFCTVDVTSKHRHKHRAQAAQVGRLRARIAEVAAADRRAAERPDLDGRQVMDLLGIGPGPVVGEALTMLLAHRRANGPLSEDQAVALLRGWAAQRGI